MEISTNSSLHSSFRPAYGWMKDYRARLVSHGDAVDNLRISILGPGGKGSAIELQVLPMGNPTDEALTQRWVERIVKMLLWQRGGSEIWLSDRSDLVAYLRNSYQNAGARAFDFQFFSESVYHRDLNFQLGDPLKNCETPVSASPIAHKATGCRIGYDLGGSDRKCAAIIDGDVVFSEEIAWSPYHQSDPTYHILGIRDSLKRAAAHLPRVDAIGGSSAGVIVDHVPQVGSLFRGLSEGAMASEIRPFFQGLSAEWGGIPVSLLNDGEVTALAGANWLGTNGVLGVAMGTSLASGYVDPAGQVGMYLNELAFCPVDFDERGPADEWSGDIGCGVQYFSQQAVFRLAKVAGIEIPEGLDGAQRLKHVQNLAEQGDERALAIFRQIGVYLGETLPFWKVFYDFNHLLLLGRVVSGVSGDLIIEHARAILKAHETDSLYQVQIHVPDETFKRHGQAIVAACIPQL